MPHNPIIVALDGFKTVKAAVEFAANLQGRVYGFKVNDLLDIGGVSVVEQLREYGQVMADPKLHDIPNTVANRAARYAAAGAGLLTVHASGGVEMMTAAVNACSSLPTGILAVTILTSLTEEIVHLTFGHPSKAAVLQFARNAKLAGVYGIVCSPQELGVLTAQRELDGLVYVIPGIRPAWYTTPDDQRRTMTPAEAIAAGAHRIIIGRPITGDPDPVAAVERTLAEIQPAT